MNEIKPINTNEKKVTETIKERPKTLMEELNELKKFKEDVLSGDKKVKKLRLPRKARVRKRGLKKGYIGILRINENRNITPEKQRISDFTYRSNTGTYHATDGSEILFWQGKFPVIIQKSWKTNPELFNPKVEDNETYGDRYKMAKMLADTIKVKSKGGSIIIWVLIGGAVLFGLNAILGGSLFG